MQKFLLPPTQEAIDGMNSGAVNFDKDPMKDDHQWKHLIVEFPDGTELSAKALNGDAKEGVYLDLQVFAIKVDGVGSTYAEWAVADMARKCQKKGSVEAAKPLPKSQEVEMVARLDALGI